MKEETQTLKKDQPKVGVYICHCGGNISDVVDVEKVRKAVENYPNVFSTHDNIFMCSNEGQELIEKDIKENGVNRIVVASCTPTLHEQTFRGAIRRGGLNEFLYEHANIREQVSWAHGHTPEAATDKAIRHVRAAIKKASLLKPLEPIKVATKKHALIIGGGVAGLRAAIDLAENGIMVDLIEKSPYLGGRVAQLHELFPLRSKSVELIEPLIQAALKHSNITIHLNADLKETSGYIGNIEVVIEKFTTRGIKPQIDNRTLQAAIKACPIQLTGEYEATGLSPRKAISVPYPANHPKTPAIDWYHCTRCDKCAEAVEESKRSLITTDPGSSEHVTLNTGVIIVATGYNHYQPFEGEFGYGTSPNIVTLPQFERMLSPTGIFNRKLELNGKTIKKVAFIHCVGSRQINGVHQAQSDGNINDYCSRVCCTATLQTSQDLKKKFPKSITYDLYRDIRTYGRSHEENYYDEAGKKAIIFLKYEGSSPPKVTLNTSEADNLLTIQIIELFSQKVLDLQVDLVVLSVGMMPRNINSLIGELNLSVGADRFLLEVHPKLRPVETANNGILLAGTCQAPMDTKETSAAASAAASKAAIILNKDYVELEPFVAKVDPQKCNGTGNCITQCEYPGAIKMVGVEHNGETVKRAEINPLICKGCGACVSVCPTEGAIDVIGYEIHQFDAMIDAFVEDFS
ncbi:MAG: CoB--CoM heterodisulfide reductase iron-sulfur subunit A family protein [Candidatus Hodarchaeota archaeon]